MTKGYTPINNDFFVPLLSLDLSGADFKVILFVYRNTIFYRTLEHSMSYTFIESGLNYSVSKAQIIRSIKKLEKLGLIKVKKAVGVHPQSIQIRVLNFDKKSTQFWIPLVLNSEYSRVLNSDNQENIEEIKYKKIKEKEKATPLISDRKLNDMTIEEARAIKDSMTPEEWEEYMRTH